MQYRDYFFGKKITVMGLGLLGRAVGDARFLASCGAELIVTDLKTEVQLKDSLEQLNDFENITFRLGRHVLDDFRDRDMILKAAGVPLNSVYIAEAKKNSIPVRMSADLFAELSGIPIVGITGTRGKSTTTHMIGHILTVAGKKVLLGGNVRGVSTLSLLPEVTPDTTAVLELDSWQLQGFGDAKLSPHVAIFTTFLPDHMNYYGGDMQRYFADKANIFLNQTESDTLIMGEQVAPFLKQYGYQTKLKAHVEIGWSKDIPKSLVLKVPGEHNRYNAGLAADAARALGIDDEVINTALESFPGIPGRLEFLGEKEGVKVYNDNNATTPDATLAALGAFGDVHNIVLIMGGSDKGLDMSPLLEEIPKCCKKVILLAGTGTDRIKNDIAGGLTSLSGGQVYQTIQEATAAAFEAAEDGDIILLSPAFASFGMFKNEYDRNDQFVDSVNRLK
jgi:UDP-N-acetylmuramoylalanine--D-glutamate ligase